MSLLEKVSKRFNKCWVCYGFTDADDSDSGQTPSSTTGVVSRRSTSKRKFKEEWKEAYLMWPNESEGYMTCILCSEKLTSFKASTITKHIERKHKQSRHFTPDKRQRLISTF